MKIVVTGGAGFIGSHVVDAYLQAGHQVVVIDNLSSGKREHINPDAKFYKMDIRAEEVREVIADERPDVINHHAAQIDVRRSVADPRFDADTNILGSIRMAEAAIEFGVKKFIYISSGGAVYGEPEYLPCDEAHPVRPICPYGASKYAFELYLHMFKLNNNLDYTILRYANVYGPRQDPHGEAGVVAIFSGQMLDQQPVTINGSGEQVRDFVYVGDCARANLMVLDSGSRDTFNLGVGQGTTINQVFEELKKLTGYPHQANYGPPKAGETFKIYLDTSHARAVLGWEPVYSLREGLQATVTYFKS
jgi:UDP-glucose 4-epimerase